MNIAVITDGYIDWNGGLDFLKIILRGLQTRPENRLYLFFISDNERKFRHIPIWAKKTIELILPYKENTAKNSFSEFTNATIVDYRMLDLNQKLVENKIDVVFPSMIDLGTNLPVKWCLELFDCQHKYYPNYFKWYVNKYRDKFFQRVLNHSNIVIVNSETAKNDYCKFYDVAPSKIHTLPLCPTLNHSLLGDDNDEIAKKYDIKTPYFIISNQFWAHKSHDTAFKAMQKLVQLGIKDIAIVCTGFMGDYRGNAHIEYLIKLIDDLDVKENIKLLGFIPKKDQIELMKHSLGVIQPSQYEGDCSGQVIDAISIGQRSIVSDIDVCKEVSYIDLITYFKLDDVDDLADKMIAYKDTIHKRPTFDELIEQENDYITAFADKLYTIIFNIANH